MYKVDLRSDAYEPISFKQCIMTDMTKLYIKWHMVAQAFAVVKYVREIAAKKSSECNEYGSFEYLLFLL